MLDLKPKLLSYLHGVLQNEKITLEFNVAENPEEILNKPYTNQEKFNMMVTKYPVLGMMKQRFDWILIRHLPRCFSILKILLLNHYFVLLSFLKV